MFCAK